MHRAPLRLRLGDVPLEVLPDGRVVVLHRGVLAMPDSTAPETVYPSLRALLTKTRDDPAQRVGAACRRS